MGVKQDASDAWTRTTGHAWYAPAEKLDTALKY